MPRSDRRPVSWALGGWATLVAVGFAWQWFQSGPEPSEVARLEQRKLRLLEEIRLLEEQRELLSQFGNVDSVLVPVPAVLTSLDMNPRRRSAYLNVGKLQGVRPRHVVVCATGVVGLVTEVSSSHCWVTLADDSEFRVQFQVSRDGETALAQGGPDPRRLRSILHRGATSYHVGDVAVTAGQDGLFPSGFLVGRVVETEAGGRRATIELPHDPARVRSVVVLTRRERS